MEIISNLFAVWFIGAFAVFALSNKTEWFGGLEKNDKIKYAAGWPYYLPKYLYLRWKDKN